MKVHTISSTHSVTNYGEGYTNELAKQFPGGFAVVRYAVCGSNLHTHWKPGEDDGYYRKYFEPFVANALKAIEQSSGRPTKIVGMFWHQGESNSDSDESVAVYREQMPVLIDNLSKTYGELPFILGEIREFDEMPRCAAINKHMHAIRLLGLTGWVCKVVAFMRVIQLAAGSSPLKDIALYSYFV